MNIVLVGLNHKTAPVELRERLSFSSRNLNHALEMLKQGSDVKEAVILSTCNRTEIYGVGENYAGTCRLLIDFLSRYHNIKLEDFRDKLYCCNQRDAVEHLFNVAAGLDSMVIGEREILGQVKSAYLEAHRYGHTGKLLNTLFQKTLNTVKLVHTQTTIDKRSVSVGSVAASLAEKVLGSLSGKKAMIIGSGKIGELTLKYLTAKGLNTIFVSNRTYFRAQELASKFSGTAVRFDECFRMIKDIDLLISSTSAPHYVINKNVAPFLSQRKERPFFFIDIAVPRDIDPEVGQIPNVYLYNIDDLKSIINNNLQERLQQVPECRQIIKQKAEQFLDGLKKTDYVTEKKGPYWFERQPVGIAAG